MEWTYDKLKIVPVADFKFQNLIVVEINEDRQVLNGTATIQVCNIGNDLFHGACSSKVPIQDITDGMMLRSYSVLLLFSKPCLNS